MQLHCLARAQVTDVMGNCVVMPTDLSSGPTNVCDTH